MTAANALAPTAHLTAFDGKDVLRTTIAVTNAGDGLSDAMAIDPIEMHLGDTVFLVIEAEVAKIRFDPIKDTNALSRVHVLRAGTGTIMDSDVVKKAIADQAEKIRLANEAAQGIQGLPFDEDLDAAHDKGEHKSLVAGCTKCDAEKAAAEDESNVKPISGRRAAKTKGTE